MRSLKICFFSILIFVAAIGCDKFEISDYRNKYLGNYYFTIISEFTYYQPFCYSIDTTVYNGLVRKYISSDSDDDMYSSNDSLENPNEKITIEFKQDLKITTLLTTNGEFIEKRNAHYHHFGKFTDKDTIEFSIIGYGGLAGYCNYYVKGIRN